MSRCCIVCGGSLEGRRQTRTCSPACRREGLAGAEVESHTTLPGYLARHRKRANAPQAS